MTEDPQTSPDRTRWWQTMPGMLSAVAAVITAVTGLVVALTQLTGGDGKASPAASTAAGPATTRAATTSGAAGGYRVTFPDGSKATVGESVYQVLAADAERRNPAELALRLSVRMTNNGAYAANFWDRTFRLDVEGVPRAPVGGLNELVEGHSAKEGDVEFVVPDTARSLTLLVGEADPVQLPLALTPS